MDIKPTMNLLAYSVMQTRPVRQDIREANEPASGPDKDSDRDDRIQTHATQRAPSVNTMGETVGRIIDRVA
jgi:hypothetical protein